VLSTGLLLAALVAAAVIARCFEPAERVPTSEVRLGEGPFHD
jgi:hypothetical protein